MIQSRLSACQGKMGSFEGHPSTHRRQTSLRKRPDWKQTVQASAVLNKCAVGPWSIDVANMQMAMKSTSDPFQPILSHIYIYIYIYIYISDTLGSLILYGKCFCPFCKVVLYYCTSKIDNVLPWVDIGTFNTSTVDISHGLPTGSDTNGALGGLLM